MLLNGLAQICGGYFGLLSFWYTACNVDKQDLRLKTSDLILFYACLNTKTLVDALLIRLKNKSLLALAAWRL